MKIAVMSDTHGNVQPSVNALKCFGNIDRLIHLGDHFRDALQIGDEVRIPVDGVSGNTDLNSGPQVGREMTLQINGIRIFITHGDLYKVKDGIDLLLEKAIIEDADIVLFGHTHSPIKRMIGDILFLNPGCILSDNANNSLALLELRGNKIEAEIIFTHTHFS